MLIMTFPKSKIIFFIEVLSKTIEKESKYQIKSTEFKLFANLYSEKYFFEQIMFEIWLLLKKMETKLTFKEKLEARYGIKGWWQIAIIFVVFGVTGSSSLYVGKFIMAWMGITETTETYIRMPVRIFLVFFVYQILLISFGTLAGQFQFFWNMEKRIINLFLKPFGKEI